MLYSVGYQLCESFDFINCIIKNKNKINEVYFSYKGLPNGRNTDYIADKLSSFEVDKKRDIDFQKLNEAGIKFNLLLNGNCYGKYALARSFYNKLGDTIDHLQSQYNLKDITTTSPVIAKFIKQNFADIKVRASVNIGAEVTEGMEYIKDLFDSFYLKREYNRNFAKLKLAREWCDENGKKLYGLANSGCLNFCSAHTFHDNLVSHESEISEMDNCYIFKGQCYEYLSDENNRKTWLEKTNFIRPEDISLYEDYFDGLKLATRVNFNPQKIVESYCSNSYSGNIFDLLEPNHSGIFVPTIIENKKIPDDFAQKTLNCNKNCRSCGYCKEIQQQSKLILE